MGACRLVCEFFGEKKVLILLAGFISKTWDGLSFSKRRQLSYGAELIWNLLRRSFQNQIINALVFLYINKIDTYENVVIVEKGETDLLTYNLIFKNRRIKEGGTDYFEVRLSVLVFWKSEIIRNFTYAGLWFLVRLKPQSLTGSALLVHSTNST